MSELVSSVLAPVLYAVSAVMWAWHQLFGALFGPASAISWVLAIVFLVATLRVLLLRPALAQLRSAHVLRGLAPRLEALRARHADDPARLLRETTALQQAHGVSTARTLLPALLQLPVFIGLLQVLEGFRDPGSANYVFTPGQVASFLDARLFGVPLSVPVNAPAGLLAGIGVERWQVVAVAVPLMLAAAVATHLTMRRSATGTAITRWLSWIMPLGLVVSGLVMPFPVGVLLYWLANNAWTYGQQWWGARVVERTPVPVPAPAAVAAAPRPGARPATRPLRRRGRRGR